MAESGGQLEWALVEKLIVGLGNPGEEYARTRHNLGFRALDAFLRLVGIEKRFTARGKARVQAVKVDGIPVLLARPSTFMNLSGTAVASLLESTGLALESLLVIHDEMDISPGRAKMKVGGGAAGHRGVEDIVGRCGEEFARIKIGIGAPAEKGEEAGMEWVLGEIGPEEDSAYADLLPLVAQAMRRWIVDGAEKAMTWFNTVQREDAGEAEVPTGEVNESDDE